MCSSLGGEISVCVLRCLLVYRELTISSIFKIPPHAVKLTLLSLFTSPATLSWHFDMRNLLILFFFLLRWGSVLFKGLSSPPPSPPDCLNPASVWIVFQFQTKDRGGITISLPFTLFQVAAAEVFLFLNHCLAVLAFFSGLSILAEFKAQHQQWARPFSAGLQGWFCSEG